jgi:curved DNA-binding protein CbpA
MAVENHGRPLSFRVMAGADEVDLDEERRRYILDVHARLGELDYYELLGVVRNAGPETLKRAYFQVAAVVHPDRYFGKRLGAYKPKMEAIFARLSYAYNALTDPTRRAQYDASLAAKDSAKAPAPKVPLDPKVAAQRQAAMDAMKERFTANKAKIQRLVDAANRARAAGDLVAAAESYREALELAPGDPALRAGYEELREGAARKLDESHVKKALIEERFGKWAEAAASWQRVVQARPDDEEARARLAHALARAARGG